MTNNYRSFFGLKKEPFGTDLKIREILETDELKAVKKRLTIPFVWEVQPLLQEKSGAANPLH